MSKLIQDLRLAVRMMIKYPAFNIIAVITLALGIGANAAIFSVVDAVLLRPLPYKNPAELVQVWEKNPKQGFPEFSVSPANFIDWQKQNNVFSRMCAIQAQDYTLTGRGAAERLHGADVSADFFEMLDVQPEFGRGLHAPDAVPGSPPVVVVSHALWKEELGGDEHVIGRVLTLNSKPRTVVGVMPSTFGSAFGVVHVWVPLILDEKALRTRGAHWLSVVARLRPRTSLQQADADMQTVASQLERQYPKSNSGWSVLLRPLRTEVVGDIQKLLLVLFGAVSFVLLIACANIANLQLARTSTRRRELAIRAALGAGRARIVRQLMTESMFLAVIGSVLGLVLARWGMDALISLDRARIPRQNEIAINGYVFGFAFTLAVFSVLLFGVAPSLQSSSIDLVATLKEGKGTAGPSRGRLRDLLVVSELALSLMLLVGAGLLVHSFTRLLSVASGLRPVNVLTFGVSLPEASYPGKEQARRFFEQLLTRISEVPGVDSVGAVSYLPLDNAMYTLQFRIEGRPTPSPLEAPSAEYRVVTPALFRTLGIPLVRGREFNVADRPDGLRVAMINQAMARRFWPNADPIGQRLTINEPLPYEIVGIVGDVRQFGLDRSAEPEMYVSQSQDSWNALSVVVRSKMTTASLPATITQEVHRLDKDLPVNDVRTMQQVLDMSVGSARLSTYLVMLFASLALVLAAIGIYGVTSYTVAQSTGDIGLRLALGATRRDIIKLVLGDGLRRLMLGVAIGIAGALILSRYLSSLLFGVSTSDPATFAIVTVVLMLVSLAACYIPARRATRVDPLIALRYE